jgi:hypothetical protein
VALQVYCGIPDVNSRYIRVAEDTGMPVLMSANGFWDARRGVFRSPDKVSHLACDRPFALDSGGFVAMSRYGGYRWSIAQYVEFVHDLCPTWWSAMDYCVEPEIARGREAVEARVRETVRSLGKCLAHAIRWSEEVAPITPPTFILQGWKPQDYARCASLMEDHILSGPAYQARIGSCAGASGEGWPSLIGVGSVCRRALHGPDGLYAVLKAIDRVLPPHVRLHLFGVKSQAVSELSDWDRIASVDSMAWSVAAWRDARRAGIPRTIALRARTMQAWWEKQTTRARPVRTEAEVIAFSHTGYLAG